MKVTSRFFAVVLLTALLLVGCVNAAMIWDESATYGALDIVLVKEGGWYVSYASLQDNNTGHYPPSSPEWWDQ
jgi:hypothetical protein